VGVERDGTEEKRPKRREGYNAGGIRGNPLPNTPYWEKKGLRRLAPIGRGKMKDAELTCRAAPRKIKFWEKSRNISERLEQFSIRAPRVLEKVI